MDPAHGAFPLLRRSLGAEMKLYTIEQPVRLPAQGWEVRAAQGCLVAEEPPSYWFSYRVVCPACLMPGIHKDTPVAAVLQKVWE